MEFRFEQLRATQAAALVTRVAGADGRINYTKLLKIMYLADRQSLIESGSTITGDRVFNMKNGHVLSEVYDCVKASPSHEHQIWSRYFRKDGYDVVLHGDPSTSKLSDFDTDVLTALALKYKGHSWQQLVEVVHALKEWNEPEDGGADLLPYEAILRAEGFSEEDVQAYQHQNAAIVAFDNATTAAYDKRVAEALAAE